MEQVVITLQDMRAETIMLQDMRAEIRSLNTRIDRSAPSMPG
jgi:hypothetical protein